MSNQKFVVTKAMLEGMCSQGLTVEQMATNFTEQAGVKVSVGKVRSWCKYYQINLRKKPTSSIFVLEPLDVVEEIVSEVVETPELPSVESVEEDPVQAAPVATMIDADDLLAHL